MPNIVEPYVRITENIRETPTLLNIDGTSNIGGVVVSPKGASYQFISGPQDLLEKLVGKNELPRNSHISLINAYYCSYFAGLVIARSLNTTAVSGAIFDLTANTGEAKEVKMLDGQLLNKKVKMKFIVPQTLGWAVKINSSVYYKATDAELSQIYQLLPGSESSNLIYTESLSDVINDINSWNGFIADQDDTDSDTIILQFNMPSEFESVDINSFFQVGIYGTVTKPTFIIDETGNIEISSNWFGFVADNPGSESDQYRLDFIKTGANYLMSVTDPDGNIESYTVSMNVNGTDDSGNNCYIGNLDYPGFNFVTNYDESDVDASNNFATYELPESITFGNSGVDLTSCKDASVMRKGLYVLAKQKEYRIEYLSDFGVTDSTFLNDYIKVGADNWWFTPVDVPYNYTNATVISYFANQLANSNNVIIAGPFDRNTGLLGWACKIAWSSKYYERIMTNKAARSEFAPAFEQTNGVLNYVNPYKLLGESDRVTLLNASSGPVNWVLFDEANNIYYTNDNRNHTTTYNIVGEEMNRRMLNKIYKDLLRILSRFKGRTNTQKTREDVISLVDQYFHSNIMNQQYKPEEYEVICDRTNNTDAIITANKLALTVRTRLLGSIKFIEVFSDVYPLGVEFTNEI